MGTIHDDRLEQQRGQARTHPVRIAILGLYAADKPLDPEYLRLAVAALAAQATSDPQDFRGELPDRPTVALIEYHLLVLRQLELLPPD
jgi:hypothetical protein